MEKPGSEARAAAAAAMNAVTEDGQLLSEVLPRVTADLEPGDKARVGRLATGALRWAGRADRLLGPYLRMKPEDPVLNLMRLAIFEIFVEGTAPHGPVDSAVSLSVKSKAGLTNAVLRNVLRGNPVWNEVGLPTLPKWLRKRLVAAWGKHPVAAMEAVHVQDVPLDLTVRDSSAAAEWATRLDATVLSTGSLRLENPGQVSALPGFDEGAWWVQDAGAALAARALAAEAGERILDLCAAPGGKTMQLAAAGAEVTALDVSKNRMERVAENLERTGLKAEIIVADATKWEPEHPFDAILLDAPCSATGTLRRHPDLAFAKDGSSIDDLVKLQATLLDRALGWLKPGGRLVFCTCSLLPDEGENQITAALDRNAGYVVTPISGDWVDPIWQTDAGALRLRPDHWADRGGIDGFFVARIEKPS